MIDAFASHDHAACAAAALSAAEALCAERGARLTPARRRALEILWESHRPLGAYALLERLKAEGHGAAPAAAYRALDFLVAQGLAHKLERLNAYVGCGAPGAAHDALFWVCGACGRAAETRGGPLCEALRAGAAAQGFQMGALALEIPVICAACRAEGTA